jgi:serine/threonine protein kinase
MYYFTMILVALHYLHSKGIVHRDLKPANILIDTFSLGVNILKIGDFGISKVDIQQMKKTITSTMGGQTSPAYIAPETIKNASPSSKVDMWALGIILYQLVASYEHPFPGDNVYSLARAITDNEVDLSSLPSTVSQYIKDTIKSLLEKNPDDRPDAK